ncbi:MAG: hypothetical protein WD076_09470, partial [Parvularculaceae bacterium]
LNPKISGAHPFFFGGVPAFAGMSGEFAPVPAFAGNDGDFPLETKGSSMKILMIALAALFFLSACGKKAPLRPPDSGASVVADPGSA